MNVTTNQTQTLDRVIRLAQKCLETVPVVVLGSGASAAYGIRGMGPLASHLVERVRPSPSDVAVWEQFKTSLARTQDLELALQEVTVSTALLCQIIRHTRSMIIEDEHKVFGRLVDRSLLLPIGKLFHHFLRSTHTTVSVVTTNYDRVAEFAANSQRLRFNVGFSEGYIRHFTNPRLPATRTTSPSARGRCIDIWKVHGSVDWFEDDAGGLISLPYSEEFPGVLSPLIVTPGVLKYERTHQEPFRSIITNADAALTSARGFLCIGYGFSDTHIEPKLVRRVLDQEVPVLILARSLRDGARKLIAKCQHGKALALEKYDGGTRAITFGCPEGEELPGLEIWDLQHLMSSSITTQ